MLLDFFKNIFKFLEKIFFILVIIPPPHHLFFFLCERLEKHSKDLFVYSSKLIIQNTAIFIKILPVKLTLTQKKPRIKMEHIDTVVLLS